MLERFLRSNPSRFDGRGGPEAAETWVTEMEKILGLTSAIYYYDIYGHLYSNRTCIWLVGKHIELSKS